MSGFDFNDLFGDNVFTDLLTGRMAEPKNEHLMSYDAKVKNRIRVNDYILRTLKAKS